MEDEISEVLHQIKTKCKQLLKEGDQYRGELPGGQLQMFASLTGLMGELRKNDLKHRRQIEDLRNQMKKEGRTLKEISDAVQEHYKQIIAGKCSILDSLPDDKILYCSKLKQIADDISECI